MFSALFFFELKCWFKSGSFYAYFFVLFLMAFASMAGAAGAFGEGSSNLNEVANSPLSIYNFTSFFNKLLLFLIPAIVGTTLYKDFKSNFHSILFTYPFTKLHYLPAKFLSSFLILSLLAFAVEAGLLAGTLIPGLNPVQIIPFNPAPYLQTFFIYLIPNLFLFSVVVFSVTLLTRNMTTGFISVILLWILREILLRFAGEPGFFLFMVDPFAETVTLHFTRFLTEAETNTVLLPLTSELLANRMFWISLSLILFIPVVRSFSFSQTAGSFFRKSAEPNSRNPIPEKSISRIKLIKTRLDFSFLSALKTSWKLSKTDFFFVTKSGAFISILIAGIIFIGVILLQVNPQTETRSLPLTRAILGLPVFFFSFLIQILTFLYAGILIHRAKNARMNDLIAATTVPNWVLLFSRVLTLLKIQILLLFLLMGSGLLFQLTSGHVQFEIGHYLFDLFVIHLIGLITWSFLALFIHTLFVSLYPGLFLLILISLGISQLPSLGIEPYIFRFNDAPNSDFYLHYSDINGHSHALMAFLIYKGYWFVFGLGLYCIALLFWQREISFSFRQRLIAAAKRFHGILAILTFSIFALFSVFGFFLYQQETKPENKILTSREEKPLLAQFQKKYSHLQQVKQPRITSVFVELNLFPETNSFQAKGTYTLVNKTGKRVNSLLIRSGYDEITTLSFSSPARLLSEDSAVQFYVYKLEPGLDPMDSMKINFTVRNQENSFLVRHSGVLKNGTYLKNDIFPRLGYFGESTKKHPSDTTAGENHYQSSDADLVHFEAILSTAPSQIALTSGYLTREWMQNGRRYFHYKMDHPIKWVVGFNSGEFETVREKVNGIDYRIFFHPEHNYNLNQLMDGLKASMDYNEMNFGPYQHKEAQIIEFPRSEGTYATTSANCIQMSEVRFTNDTSKISSGGVDLSFYVAAHELAHQWWGNQVIPANALGATMMTESIAEYITAKIYEKKYGKKSALRFLEIQHDRYLMGRANETGTEVPLILAEPEQSYLTYGKGALAFYILSEHIGEKTLNQALKSFLDKVKNQSQYPTSLELLDFLKQATPESQQFLIEDLFESTSAEKLILHFEGIKNQESSEK